MFSCVPMFESLLKMHPRDPSLVRPNGRRATRLAVRVPRRALRKPARCTGRPHCHPPPLGQLRLLPAIRLAPQTPINFLKVRKMNWDLFWTSASSAPTPTCLLRLGPASIGARTWSSKYAKLGLSCEILLVSVACCAADRRTERRAAPRPGRTLPQRSAHQGHRPSVEPAEWSTMAKTTPSC